MMLPNLQLAEKPCQDHTTGSTNYHILKEKNTNDYIPAILLAWHGNMDIQFIGEESKVLTRYCIKYATKLEKTQAAHVLADMVSNKTNNTKLWNFATRQLTH